MTSKDQLKLLKAGFRIIRSDEHNLLIKFKDNEHLNWTVLKNGFVSKAALKREMEKLLNLSIIIED